MVKPLVFFRKPPKPLLLRNGLPDLLRLHAILVIAAMISTSKKKVLNVADQ